MTPYDTRDEAAYWGGGVIVEAAQGGYWSLHGYSTPTAPELYYRGHECSADGWPPEVRGVYVWAVPEGGCTATICRRAGEAGRDLEDRIGPSAAGALIYAASGSHPVPDWGATEADALTDLRARAARGAE